MKKILFVLLSFIGITGCEKKEKEDPKFCWKCYSAVTTTVPGAPTQYQNHTSTYCDKTEDEIKTIKGSLNSTTTSQTGGITVTVKNVTTCSKQ